MGINVIETINSLSELKAYCCPKVVHLNEWYLKCVDCKSLKDCSCGIRAVEIMNKATKPITDNPKTMSPKDEYVLALQQDDPIGWVMKRFHLKNRTQGSMRLTRYKKKFPDIAKKYNHRDMRKYNLMNLGPHVHCTDNLESKVYEVFSQLDPVEYYINQFKVARKSARNTINRWNKKFPEIGIECNIITKLNKNTLDSMAKEVKVMNNSIDEEMSITEFLKEQSAMQDLGQNEDADRYKIDDAIYVKFDDTKIKHSNEDNDPLLKAIRDKQKAIQKDIEDLRNQEAFLVSQIETLNKSYYILTGKVPE